MESIMDSKDWQIIRELQMHSRNPLSTMAKDVGLSLNTLKKRLKRLQDENILPFIITMVDYPGLGYQSHIAYIRLQNCNKHGEQEIIKHLCLSPYTWFVASSQGEYNLIAVFFARRHEDFNDIWRELKAKFRNHIFDFSTVPLFSLKHFGCFNEESALEDRVVHTIGSGKRYSLSKADVEILNLMMPDARIPVSKLSEKIGLPKNTVKFRISKMEKEGLIQGYDPMINMDKLGYLFFKVDFFLSSCKELSELEKRLEKERGIMMTIKSGGNADASIMIYSRSIYELNSFLKDLQEEFPDIASYRVNTVLKMFKGIPFFL